VAQVGLIFGISSAMDMTLFYPAGAVMDRWGRKWIAVPSLILLSVSIALIPATDSFITLTLVGVLSGFANGIGAGIAMTLGADFAPPEARGEFLGVWRLVGDIGGSGGPVAIAAITGVASLGLAAGGIAICGMLGAVVLARMVPEPLQRGTRRMPVPESAPAPP
jgi:MFS family permease